ncbi:hypothetical protein WJX75_008748 [Coccomyxa subellipsoidea]|uniref:Uncharacterized protein n=1 Tax=Coccomyxa subellipsoidea TaxID=248742 RepID=A0ABR2YLI0_9CHLO
MSTSSECSCSSRSIYRDSGAARVLLFAFLVVSAPFCKAQVQVLDGAGFGAYSGQLIPTGRVVQLVSQPQVFSADQPSGIIASNPYAALLAAAQQAQQDQPAQQDPYGDSRSFAESQAASLLANQEPDAQTISADQELADQQASAELASKLFQGISNLTSTLAQRYSQAASEKANATATLGQTAQKSQPGDAIADMPDAIAEERKAIAQVTQPSNMFQTGDDSSLASQQPSLTVVKVEQSSAEPNVRHVEVMTLQKKHKVAAAVKPLATRPEDARLEAAAAPAGAVQSAPAPVQAPAAQPSFEPAGPLKVFQQKREDKSFEKRAEETLRRIAAGPASNVEVISAPDIVPAGGAQAALAPNDMRTLVAKHKGKKAAAAVAAAPADGLQSIQVNRKYGGDSLGAQIAEAAAAPAQPREAALAKAAFGNGPIVMQQLLAVTHPAVIWQSHLLDITPAQWPSYKDSYISGIAQGANVDQSQVTIVSVTSASTVTVNTQITYPNDDTAAAKELTTSLKDAQGAPVYIPNFGQVQVSDISQLDAPAVPQFSSSQVSWTGTSAAALGPATPSSYAPALQPGASLGVAATTQQSLSTLQQQQTPATDPSAVPQVKRQDKVYNNNGLPLGAAIAIPLGVVAIVALLLVAAHYQRKSTERLTKSLLSDPAAASSLKARSDTNDTEA